LDYYNPFFMSGGSVLWGRQRILYRLHCKLLNENEMKSAMIYLKFVQKPT